MYEISGDETKTMIKQIARDMSSNLLAGASAGDKQQMNNALDITYWQAVYCLGNLVFNQSMVDANHNIKNISMHTMIHLDSLKEDIMTEVDAMIAGFKKGEVEMTKPKQ